MSMSSSLGSRLLLISCVFAFIVGAAERLSAADGQGQFTGLKGTITRKSFEEIKTISGRQFLAIQAAAAVPELAPLHAENYRRIKVMDTDTTIVITFDNSEEPPPGMIVRGCAQCVSVELSKDDLRILGWSFDR